MSAIFIDVQEVSRAAGRLATLKRSLQDEEARIKAIENDVEAYWISKYTADYIACLAATRRKIEALVSTIGTLSSNLYTIAAKAQEADQNLTSTIGGSGGGGGSSWGDERGRSSGGGGGSAFGGGSGGGFR